MNYVFVAVIFLLIGIFLKQWFHSKIVAILKSHTNVQVALVSAADLKVENFRKIIIDENRKYKESVATKNQEINYLKERVNEIIVSRRVSLKNQETIIENMNKELLASEPQKTKDLRKRIVELEKEVAELCQHIELFKRQIENGRYDSRCVFTPFRKTRSQTG